MPTNYTPVPGNAPATNTFPSDLDDADAESVNKALRAAADNLMGLAAIKANANTMAGVNTFLRGIVIDEPSASTPLLKTTLASTKDSNPSNAWQPIIESENVRLYTGDNAGAATGGMALTYNAKWVPANNRWEAQVSAHNAVALIMNYGDIYVTAQKSQVTGGPANWAAWPAFGTPNLRGDIFVSRNVQLTGDLIAGDNGVFGGAVSAPFFDYLSPQTRSNLLFPEGGFAGNTLYSVLNPGQQALYRINVPTQATLGEVTVKVRESAACTYEIYLYKIDSIDFAATDIASLPAITTVDSGSYGPGILNAILNWTLDYGGMPVDNPNHVYYVRVLCPGGSPTSIDVYTPRVVWSDPGPRNH